MATTETPTAVKKQSSKVRVITRVVGLLVIFLVGAGLIGVNATFIAKGFEGRAQVEAGLLAENVTVGEGAPAYVGERVHNGVTAQAEADLVKKHEYNASDEHWTASQVPKPQDGDSPELIAKRAKIKASLQTGDAIRGSLMVAVLADNTATAFIVKGFEGLGTDLLVIFAAASALVILTRPRKVVEA